jgi:hypothetical protein
MRKVLLVVALVAAMLVSGWAYTSYNKFRAATDMRQFNEDVNDLFDSLQKYKERAGSYPAGNNAEIVKCLQGNNPKNIIIVVGHKKNFNTKGELIDPWGTPFRIYFAGEGILIRSAGPNKRFDDSTVPNSDDYYRAN